MRFVSIIFFLCVINVSVTATLITDSCKIINRETQIQEYLKATGSLSLIYQGIEQEKYPVYYRKSPYFSYPEYTKGQIWIKGVHYTDVSMRIDVYRHQLIVQSHDQPYNVVIPHEKFDSAFIHGFKLKYFPEFIRKNNSVGTFLLILFDEKVKLYIQPEARLRKISDGHKINYEFVQTNKFFIEKSGEIHAVKNLRSLQHIFPEQRSQISEITKANKLSFRKNPAGSLLVLLKTLSFE